MIEHTQEPLHAMNVLMGWHTLNGRHFFWIRRDAICTYHDTEEVYAAHAETALGSVDGDPRLLDVIEDCLEALVVLFCGVTEHENVVHEIKDTSQPFQQVRHLTLEILQG